MSTFLLDGVVSSSRSRARRKLGLDRPTIGQAAASLIAHLRRFVEWFT